jgi:GAF domain-containing protein
MPSIHPTTISHTQTDGYVAALEALVTTISQRTDTIKILAEILSQALLLSGLEVGGLLVLGDEQDNMNVVVKRYLPDEITWQLTKGGLSRRLLSGESVLIQLHPLQPGGEQVLLRRHSLRYLFGLPFRFETRTLGALVIATRREVPVSTRQQLQERLGVLAQVVTLFLENMRLRTAYHRNLFIEANSPQAGRNVDSEDVDAFFPRQESNDLEELLAAVMTAEEEVARQNEDLDMLNTLATEMSKTFQVEMILQKATALAKTALNAKAGWCYLLEDDMLVLQESEGLSERYTHGMKRLKPGSGTEGMAIARNELMIRDGLLFHSGRERDLVKEEGLYTVAAVPLCHQDRVIGALSVGWRDPKQQCSLRDKRMLMAVSQQVVWAVVNARMFNRIREEAHTWESSYRALTHVNEIATGLRPWKSSYRTCAMLNNKSGLFWRLRSGRGTYRKEWGPAMKSWSIP